MSQRTIVSTARDVEKCARELRGFESQLEVTDVGGIQTLRYCGAMLSMVSSTLCQMHEELHPVFSKDCMNGILREWGLEEIEEADSDEEF